MQVTEPDGTPLGTSVGSANETPVQVVNGQFVGCYQLSAILVRVSDGSPGYDNTSNPGREYKVWVSVARDFAPQNSKTDNFKAPPDQGGPTPE